MLISVIPFILLSLETSSSSSSAGAKASSRCLQNLPGLPSKTDAWSREIQGNCMYSVPTFSIHETITWQADSN